MKLVKRVQLIFDWLESKYFFFSIVIIVVLTAAYIVLLLNKYWQFEFFAVDNVLFDRALWLVAHFQAPIIDHTTLGRINILGDHFHPTIFIVSLFYMLIPHREDVFVIMSVSYGLSAYVFLLIGREVIKHKFVIPFLLLAYFLYLGTQNAMLFGFHELNFVPLFFSLTTYFLLKGKIKLYALSLALLLLTKESMAVVAFCLGFFALIAIPEKRKLAVATMVFSLGYFFFVTRVVIPHFSGQYLYGEITLPTTLNGWVAKFTYPPEKIQTFVVSLATFSFLPLLNLATLPLVLQDFFMRYVFSLSGSIQYRLFYHYNIALAPMLLFSSIWSIHTWEKSKWKSLLWPLCIINLCTVIFFHRFYYLKGPLGLVINPAFYQVTTNNKFLWDLVNKVPKEGSVMTQNHLEYVFADRQVFDFTDSLNKIQLEKPTYIVYDLRPGQNPNNFFPISDERLKTITDTLIKEKFYSIYFNKGSTYILKINH